MRDHNICFHLEVRKIIFELSSLPLLIWNWMFFEVLGKKENLVGSSLTASGAHFVTPY